MNNKNITKGLIACVAISGAVINSFANNKENIKEIQYRTVDENQIVNIPDSNLKKGINVALGKGEVLEDISIREMRSLTSLTVSDRNISNIGGLEYAINLRYLNLNNNNISDISSINGLVNLNELRFSFNNISDISPLSNLINLRYLYMHNNRIVDIEALNNLTKLIYLEINNNEISNISSLSNLTNLTNLRLHRNNIEDISPLSNLINLNSLYLNDNNIENISSLRNLTNLTSIDLARNNIRDISVLGNLVNLVNLTFNSNKIVDISSLSNLVKLKTLWCYSNYIEDISSLSKIKTLNHLYIYNNQISELNALNECLDLKTLQIGKNQISDIEPLSNLTNLTNLHIDNNQISNISPLRSLTNLTNLNMYNNKISDISSLRDLINLRYLHLYNNKITDISPLSNLSNLDTLYMSHNKISNIEVLRNLTKLIYLHIGDNQISDISPLKDLVNLIDLEIYRNNISEIDSLSNLTNLTNLYIYDNKISDLSVLKKLTKINSLKLHNQKPTISKIIKSDSNIFNVKIDNPIKGINGEKIEITSISNNGYYKNGKICWDNLDVGDYTFNINFNKIYNINGNDTTYNGTATINLNVIDGVAPEVSNDDFINEDELAIYTTITAEDLFSEVDYLIHNKERHSLPYTFKYDVFNMDNNAVEVFDTAGNSTIYNITPNNLSAEVLNQYIDTVSLNATSENIRYIRTIVNNMSESSNKDILSERINDIPLNIELEKKISSANLDVYIKSENILQMSLDTNLISFDDFSGIEDVEKVNAVNLTINSSLPYQLNAYLLSEIQNSDKTKTLDKNILNIKESSESDYQTFTNTTDKIVLKDNCSSGNYLIHGVDLKLAGGIAHEKDVYKATIKLEAEQK